MDNSAINEESVAPQSQEKFTCYLNWLKENGCVFPRVEYPAKLDEFEAIGARALYDIPP